MDLELWRQSVTADFLTMARAPRERLRWITLILAVRVVRLGDDPAHEVASIIEALPAELRACAMTSGFIKRGTRWAGVVEIDLLHPRLLGGAVKRDLIGLLAGVDPDTLAPDQRVIVVHLHAVVDAKGHVSPEKFVRDARKFWPGARRVHSASIWTEGTVAENLERLASYSTKLRFQYSQSWDGTKTKFFMPYEPAWKAWMHRLHDNLGLSNLVISSVSSRAVWCTHDDAESLAAQGLHENDEGSQLNTDPDIQDEPQQPIIKTLMQRIMEKQHNERTLSDPVSRTGVSTNYPPSRYDQAQGAAGHQRTGTGDCVVAAADPADEARPPSRGHSDQAVDPDAVDEAGREEPGAPAEDQGHTGIGQQAHCRHPIQDWSVASEADDPPPPRTRVLVEQVPISVEQLP